MPQYDPDTKIWTDDEGHEIFFDAAMELAIIAEIRPRFANHGEVFSWFFSEPIPGFGGHTARTLARMGRGQEVLDYIQAVDAGIHS